MSNKYQLLCLPLFSTFGDLLWIRSGDAIRNASTKLRFHMFFLFLTFLAMCITYQLYCPCYWSLLGPLRLHIDCLLLALDVHMLSHNGYGLGPGPKKGAGPRHCGGCHHPSSIPAAAVTTPPTPNGNRVYKYIYIYHERCIHNVVVIWWFLILDT